MSTISINPDIFQYASLYAKQHQTSVQNLIESYLLSLRDKIQGPGGKDSSTSSVLSFHELRPELQAILHMSEPLKGQIPEWDLNGELAREEALNEQ